MDFFPEVRCWIHKSAFLKGIASSGAGRIMIMIYYFLDSGILHFPAIAGVIPADMTNWKFPCGSGGERIARQLQNMIDFS